MFIKHEEIKPIEFDRLRIVDYTAGRDTSSSFAEITVPPGISHRLSWSTRSDKFYYLVQGTISFTIDNETQTLHPGDVCIVPKGSRFHYSNPGPGDAKLILIHTPSFELQCEVFE